MQLERLTVRPACPGDARDVQALLADAASFARAQRHPMWPRMFPMGRVRAWTRSGELYLAVLDGELAGVFLLQSTDPGTWGEDRRPARYVHRLAVPRAQAGRGVGRALVEWAAREATGLGAEVLRLDTVRANPRLRAYYEALGFRAVGDRRVGGRWVRLYERPLGPGGNRARRPIARPGSLPRSGRRTARRPRRRAL